MTRYDVLIVGTGAGGGTLVGAPVPASGGHEVTAR